ncbi:MAG: aldo/keto reductase, partial [Clostridia bacterium]|nr:aldo/keto reductase [Clostridia bacterium]
MKRILGVLLCIMAILGLTACGNNDGTKPALPNASKVLIAYFSCTETTEAVAKHIEKETKGTLYEIVPQTPYTAEDLKYYTNGRADREQDDPSARPAIDGSVENMEQYDVIFLGYPIWHGQAPRIISTFLESYDFSGKTIVPFCTSHSSGIGSSDTNLHSLANSARWIAGKRFPSGTSQKSVAEWIESLDIKLSSDVSVFDLDNGENGRAPTVTLNSGYEMPVLGIGTYSLRGETCVNSVLSALESGVR